MQESSEVVKVGTVLNIGSTESTKRANIETPGFNLTIFKGKTKKR